MEGFYHDSTYHVAHILRDRKITLDCKNQEGYNTFKQNMKKNRMDILMRQNKHVCCTVFKSFQFGTCDHTV